MSSQQLPDGLVVLTFDDGVRSQYQFAAPLLEANGFGATFYITEGLNFLTDKALCVTWDEVKDLDDRGFEIGNHTRHHRSVASQPSAELRADIDHIDDRLAGYGIQPAKTFCYPAYSHSPSALDVLKDRGFTFARRGPAPEFEYNREGGRGPAYDPRHHDPLLVPTTGAAGPDWSLDDFLWALDLARDGAAAVLTFHGVPDLEHPWVNTSQAFFEHCISHLAANDYTVIALRDVEQHLSAGFTKGQ